jgi:hypothetical protein
MGFYVLGKKYVIGLNSFEPNYTVDLYIDIQQLWKASKINVGLQVAAKKRQCFVPPANRWSSNPLISAVKNVSKKPGLFINLFIFLERNSKRKGTKASNSLVPFDLV